MHVRAGHSTTIDQREKIPHFIEAKPKVAAPFYERQAIEMRRFIEPLATFGASWLGHHANALIVANCLDIDARLT
jgi:hypothetical protein